MHLADKLIPPYDAKLIRGGSFMPRGKRIATRGGQGTVQMAIDALRTRERELHAELATLQGALRSLSASASKGPTATVSASSGAAPKRKHKMSAAGRAAISKAAKKRWAAFHAAKRKKTK